jgi:hypothetical protein
VYGSDPFSYDFEAVSPARGKRPTPQQVGKSFGSACGKLAGEYAETFWASREHELDPGSANVVAVHRVEHHLTHSTIPTLTFTAKQLERHIELYGPEGTEHIKVGVGSLPPRRRAAQPRKKVPQP